MIQCNPGRCPGLISYWAFSPSLLRANHLFKVKQQNFKPNEVAEIIFLIIATEEHGTTRMCRENPSVDSMSVFFCDIPLLLQGGLLTLQTIKQYNQ
ncbi:hypothetical protein [Hoylesella timonensis]|uniref:hypothetical protein n=1 Tax=Hoylesella timonensis TaxID=386414 RepID=UPI0028895051|nr:hypothetical protein [Hoylesella timonensis]